MNWKEHIESDPGIMYGKPVFKDTRIPVDLILEKLAAEETPDDILKAYPSLRRDAIYAALAFAADIVKNEIVYSLAS